MIRKFHKFRPHGTVQPYLSDNQPETVSTAFWLIFSALGCELSVRSVSVNPNGRMGPFLSLMRDMGLNPVKGFSGLKLMNANLSGITLSVNEDNIDFVPMLCVLASRANGISCFAVEDTQSESEYIGSTLKRCADFAKALDIDYMYLNDRLLIKGRTKTVKGGIVDCGGDYRFVLSSILASAVCDEEISISYFECASDKFPDLNTNIAELA